MTKVSARRLLTVLVVVLTTHHTVAQTSTTTPDDQQLNGPLIIPSKSEVILQKGENYILTCKGKTEIQFVQQEIDEEVTGPFHAIHRNWSIVDDEYRYQAVIELNNVNQFTIGYYACFDNTVPGFDILNNMMEEPNNTAHITFIYIFVDGTDSLFAPMSEVVSPRDGNMVVIECRPTTPDVEVSLMSEIAETYEQYSPKIGFTFDRDAFSDLPYYLINCEFKRRDGSHSTKEIMIPKQIKPPPQPAVESSFELFMEGETFVIVCYVDYKSGHVVELSWRKPELVANETIHESTNENSLKADDNLYKNLTIVNATRSHAGNYCCDSSNTIGKKSKCYEKKFVDTPFIRFKRLQESPLFTSMKKMIRLSVEVEAYPPITSYYYLRNNVSLPMDPKFEVKMISSGDINLTIKNVQVTDAANYTLVASNKHKTNRTTYDVRVYAPPVVTFGTDGRVTYMKNSIRTLKCSVTGYPLPKIVWAFTREDSYQEELYNSTSVQEESLYKQTAFLNIEVQDSGNFTCVAINWKGNDSSSQEVFVYEMDNGFGIYNKENNWFSQNQDVVLTCLASKYDYKEVNWTEKNGEAMVEVEYSMTPLSHVAKLKLYHVSMVHSGDYTCTGKRVDNTTEDTDTLSITVAAIYPPVIIDLSVDTADEPQRFQTIHLSCLAYGVPPPTLEWQKDGVPIKNGTIQIWMEKFNRTTINSTIEIKQLQNEDQGDYECVVTSDDKETRRSYKLVLTGETSKALIGVIIGIIFALIILVAYLTWKIKKEKQFKRELRAAGLLYFKKGVTKSLNPDLGLGEQAELLPYNEKFEFPPEKLKLGKQLGAGAFGVVYKAEARGIINAEENTEVAVKMVKKTADNMYIKALASELKIMVHLGKHINIVNLLGACTKNVGKRELIVIVEYCKFGNIHNYMQRHRDVFIDQLTDNKEANLGRVNRAFSTTSGSTGAGSDYFGTNNTQDTDHTFVNTANTGRSGRKVSEGYVQPEWRTNYESDYSYDGRNPRPLTSRDLLAWAFQIARGMEYLASRKVLHGDLAARNILLADDNIVKICDFGLARSIYNNDEYQKKENSLLPVKWLAIECMTDRIFSTQSDVWSFGIVLWELFSLAKTPYPSISLTDLLQWLTEGNRLAKPTYANDKLYNVMLRCWEQKPTARPSFSQLQEILGNFLEDNVRNHYVDLNSAYTQMNPLPVDQEDYLAMVCAPDYNNLVTPSPHHYVNDTNSFFPNSPTQLDEEGYLQMSPASKQAIFSPRTQDTKFDFDSRKFNPRASEASNGSELTPMLTLNHLPRSGSESDHEGSASPYLKTCPSIKEETDEVFETKQNNTKNMQNTAVTNPTYITFDTEIEKKPKDIINSYINVPNGLVK